MTNNIIKFDNYTKKFHNETVLNNITLSIEEGKCYGFVGRNGSGKSLLFKALCGFIRASSGDVYVNGMKIGTEIDFPENTGILIESPGFLPSYSALDNLKFLASINNKIQDNQIIDTLKLVGLDPANKKKVKNFSLGMKQRLGIAQAIMEDPSLLVLDEPMNGLDKNGVLHIRNILLELKKSNKTILLTSHIQQDIDELCDHVYEMDDGNLSIIR
ncbi:ABC transporter ATP-binding protein [Clostridium manihotivorum]|uniref:Multidrug ABC transporter ATP-binding protein n=1 Tax=Clostridium manihotivorum TaxID=2320868 RepID=A0A3R5TJY9_9CLOT|nr:ABC transporter ATP-binding protein [Clostridium manihotivorum]QAA35227.1 multidrug ABC transporter ATP-binding protein [Clostridium manihotivorum]